MRVHWNLQYVPCVSGVYAAGRVTIASLPPPLTFSVSLFVLCVAVPMFWVENERTNSVPSAGELLVKARQLYHDTFGHPEDVGEVRYTTRLRSFAGTF